MTQIRLLEKEVSCVLDPHKLFQTDDLDEAREHVAKVFCPHKLSVMRAGEKVNVRMDYLPVGGISLTRLNYGTTVDVDPGLLERFFVVHFPLSGVSLVSCGKETVISTPQVANVVTPTQPMRLQIRNGCDLLILKIDRRLMERTCTQHLGYELSHPVEFSPAIRLESSACQSLSRLIEMLVAAASEETGMIDSPLYRSNFEQLATTTLLYCQPNSYSDELRRPARPIAPFYIKRAEEYIQANADRPITVGELAEHVGVSTRSLYAGFQRFRGSSPKAILKSIRLERVRKDLLEASERRWTVTEVAMRWGFGHMSQFSADYKRRFGITPSETMQRSNSEFSF